MVVAEALSAADAIAFVHARAFAVSRHADLESGLLSVGASSDEVQSALRSFPLPIQLTHDNSPRQSVVGGRREHLLAFQKAIEPKRWSSMLLNVPVAFHTHLMSAAQMALVDAAQRVSIRPPRIPIFSTVSGRLTCDPDELRRNLLDQLTHPVLYRANIETAHRWGCNVFVELGPGSVLTKLNRAILPAESAVSIALDEGESNESIRGKIAVAHSFTGKSQVPSIPSQQAALPRASTPQPILSLDATEARRKKRREQASQQPVASTSASRVLQPSAAREDDREPTPVVLESRAMTDSVSDAVNPSDVEAFVRDFIVEHTGYPPR